MPVCSKCQHNTLGHPKPVGSNCVWDGKPVAEKDNLEDSDKFHSPENTGSSPSKEKQPAPPQKSPPKDTDVVPTPEIPGPSKSTPSPQDDDQDAILTKLMQRLKEAEDRLKAKKEKKEKARKAELIINITKRLDLIEKELAEPDDIPIMDPLNSIYANAVQKSSEKQGNAPIANLTPVFSNLQQTQSSNLGPVFSNLQQFGDTQCSVGPQAHQVKAAMQPGLKTCRNAADQISPVQGEVLATHPFINHDGASQGIIQSNSKAKALTKGVIDQAAKQDDAEGKPYLPHDYVLKPGVRDCKSVEDLSFSEFVLAYARMLEAMLQNNELIADRLEFFIRIVSECTHKRWYEVKELYLLFEQEVIKKRKRWNQSFYGAIEKLAYESAKHNQQGNSSGKQHHTGAVNHQGSEVKAPCKDFNWLQQGCSRPAVSCKYLHMCFQCWNSHGMVEGHRAKDCPYRNAVAHQHSLTPNAQPPGQPSL